MFTKLVDELLSMEDCIMNFQDFKEGIFSLRTRRFGTVAEYMIKALIKVDMSGNLAYDLTDSYLNRIEVKFSTVMRKNKETITESNVIQQILNSTVEHRMIDSHDILTEKFDCNIQQVKTVEFDILYYGLFFQDRIAIFLVNSEDVFSLPNYSDKQHRGNEGEGQFHLNEKTIKYHLDNHLYRWVNYEELYDLLLTLPNK